MIDYLGVEHQDNDEPEVSKDGEEGGDEEHWEVPDPSDLSVRDSHDTDGGDGQEVEGGGTHDGAGTQFVRLEVVTNDPDDGQEDFRGRGAWKEK